MFPDAFLTLDFMAAEVEEILAGLRVDERRMRTTIEAGGGLASSQRVLLALTAAGMARDEAYAIVQRHALAALEGAEEFRAGLAADPDVTAKLTPEALAQCFDWAPSLRHVDALFARAEYPEA